MNSPFGSFSISSEISANDQKIMYSLFLVSALGNYSGEFSSFLEPFVC